MHFRFDDDQVAMRDAVRSLCADHFDLAGVARREGGPAAPAAWSALADLGVLGMLGDEGGGIGVVEATVVFEELGAHLAGGPVLWTTLAAPSVPGAAGGAARVTGIEVGNGVEGPVVVEHADESQVLVVLRGDRAEVCPLVDVPRSGEGSPMDPLTPVAVLASAPTGDVVAEGAAVQRLRRDGRILAAASLVGGAQGVLDVARAYALEREQFGVPIGSFQAIKHILADMYVRVEMARAATYAAAAIAAGKGDGDPDLAARTAKHLAGEAAVLNARAGIQVLGGMGFTWDMLPHYFLKRAFVLDLAFGTESEHAARLGTAVGAEMAST
ncbi:MAG TPA: acyl-CoA dehydrogenase family protein [Acidimicrobiales bacterium]|nr:acyl-CoA dehydrogenase family protein [Acidimicrobiales bacterium]